MTRIERAARAMADRFGFDWDFMSEDWRGDYEDIASAVLLAAEPELHQEPPTHWRAPMAMTNPMNSAATAAVNLADDGEADARLNYAEVDAIYEAARDAHLKETP